MKLEIIKGKAMSGKTTKLMTKVVEKLKDEKVLLFWLEDTTLSLSGHFATLPQYKKDRLTIVTGISGPHEIKNIIAAFHKTGGSFVAIDSILMVPLYVSRQATKDLEELCEEYNLDMIVTE